MARIKGFDVEIVPTEDGKWRAAVKREGSMEIYLTEPHQKRNILERTIKKLIRDLIGQHILDALKDLLDKVFG